MANEPANTGGEILSDGSTSTGSATPAPGFSGGDSAIELNDDTLIRVKGETEPVKYGEWSKKSFVPKSDFTRAQQAAAQERQREIQSREQAIKDRDARLAAYERQQTSAQPQANPISALVEQLKAKPYLSGEEAAGVVTQMWQGGIQPLAQAISQRDEVIKLLYQRLMNVDTTVGGLKGQQTEAQMSARYAKVKAELGLPDDPMVDEFLQDVYLSHEGQDLDTEFPNMVKARWESFQKLMRANDQRRAEEARKQRFLPGQKGGNATPGRPLRTGFKDAKQLADELFPALLGGQT